MHVRIPVLVLAALAFPAATPAADREERLKSSAPVFGLDRVWSMHLTIAAGDWKTMEPTRRPGPFAGPRPNEPEAKPAEPSKDRRAHGGFGFDFAYVKATLEIDGQKFKDVGVRFKGNLTYASSQGRLKRPFKISLARYVPGQNFKGLKKLTLNNNVTDPTCAREVLSYAVYRALDVPASRTAYVRLTLTVPGKYDRELVGLYTLVEPVDKTFLKSRFGSSKGLLLKPERVGPLEYLGEEWAPYERTYQPRTSAGKKAQRRLMEFTKLVQRADDRTSAQEIGNYLDVDEFLRYLAGTVALSSMDSFIGMGHNYYLYLDPRTSKFVILPWDLDLTFGAMGSPEQLMDLSIRQPQMNRNRLIERLFANEKVFAAYKGHLEKLLDKGFTPEGVRKDLAAINAAIGPAQAQEARAVAARREGGGRGFGGPFNRASNLETFVARRAASVREQLAGKRKGTVMARGFGPPPMGGGFGPPMGFGAGMMLVRPILDAADRDRDGKLSREEVIAAVKALFKALDKEDKGELDQKAVAAGLDKLLPGPRGFDGPRGGPFPMQGGGPGAGWARAVVEKAGKNGKVTEASLVAAAVKLFTEADRNRDGKLDERELAEALNKLMPPPQFGPPNGMGFGPGQFLVRPILAAADRDGDGKLSKAEVTVAVKALFKTLDRDGKGELDEKAVAAGLDRLMPGPRGFGGRRGGPFPGPGAGWARAVLQKAGKNGKVTEAGLVAAANKLFAEADRNRNGKLDERQLAEALNKLMPPPQFGPPNGGPFGPPNGGPPRGPRPQGPVERGAKEGGK
jgi:Ca2+-binding EF-hand superfamily protein